MVKPAILSLPRLHFLAGNCLRGPPGADQDEDINEERQAVARAGVINQNLARLIRAMRTCNLIVLVFCRQILSVAWLSFCS